ncbi:Flavodoxin domain-containing protein [Hyaloraphidium curvatum]|nr:Flavodoxin domain-containing protein [Hyaloraphidium curvatum]
MKVLVAYETDHGSTKEIAEAIAERLRGEPGLAGVAVDVVRMRNADPAKLAGYDAAVVGSSIHNQEWLPEAAPFVAGAAESLRTGIPVWLFSVSSLGATSSVMADVPAALLRWLRGDAVPADVAKLKEALDVVDHRFFAGRLDRTDIPGGPGYVMAAWLTLTMGTYGDHRDWTDIGQWTDGIAERLAELQGAHPSDKQSKSSA